MCKCKCECKSSNCCELVKKPVFMACFITLSSAIAYLLAAFTIGRVTKPSTLLRRTFVSMAGFMVGQAIATAILGDPDKKKNTEE